MKTSPSTRTRRSAPCGCTRCHCRALGGTCRCAAHNALMALILWDFARARRKAARYGFPVALR